MTWGVLLVQARQRHAAELAQLNTEHETAVKEAREAAEGRLQSAMLDAETSYNAALEEKKREIQTRVEAEQKQLEEALKAGWEKRKETLDAEGRARALQEAEDEERALKAAHQQRLDDLKDELERQLREFTQVGAALCLSRSRSRLSLSSAASAAGPVRVLRSRFFARRPPTPHACQGRFCRFSGALPRDCWLELEMFGGLRGGIMFSLRQLLTAVNWCW